MLVEGAQDGLLDFIRDGHVIFDGVQSTQNEVEYAYLKSKSGRVSEHQMTAAVMHDKK